MSEAKKTPVIKNVKRPKIELVTCFKFDPADHIPGSKLGMLPVGTKFEIYKDEYPPKFEVLTQRV